MILCYQGSPGSGKTYDAVNRVVENLKRGRVVYTNIDGLDDSLNREVIKVLTNLDDYEISQKLIFLSSDQIACFWKHAKAGSMVVIDEIHNWFNSRDWQSAKNREFASWASTHRHQGYDVIMITQNIQKVDSQVRSVVEFTYEYRKLNMFGPLFKNRYICYAYMGGEATGKPMGKNTRTYNQKIFAAYKSYITGDVKELGIQTQFNILKHPIFYSIPVVLILFLYFFSKSSFARGDFLGMNPKKPAIVKKVEPVTVATVEHKGPVQSAPVMLYERKLDPFGKQLSESKRVFSGGDKKKVSVKRPQKASVKPLEVGQAGPLNNVLPVRNYQGFVSSGDVLYVLIGSKKTSLSNLKTLYPDAEIVDGSLRLSGTIYSPGQTVPL